MFLKTAAGIGAAIAAGSRRSVHAQPVGANDAIRVGIIGLGNKGPAHLNDLLKMPDVRIAALCDVDVARLAAALTTARTAGAEPFAAVDPRRVFERHDVDAVVIASPDHWHAAHAVWACQAGKDVYVEKPVANTVWAGRKIIEAARRHGRIVQAGTQARSDPGIQQAVQHLREGHLGKVLWAHAMWYRKRPSIGRRPPWYPEGIDFDLFMGPAPMVPLVRDQLHYDWHWFWDTGHGEMTNLGAHCIDLAHWFGGISTPARRVCSVGGRFALGDSGETPNTQLALFDRGPDAVPVIMECRGLEAAPDAGYVDHLRGIRSGVVVQCEGGYFAGHYGGATYDNEGKRIQPFPGDGGAGHMANFLAAMRSRRTEDLAAPIELGQLGTSTCLLAGISYRSGRATSVAEARARFETQPFAAAAFDAMITHLGKHAIDLEQRDRLTAGAWLDLDDTGEGIATVEDADEATLERARFLLRDTQRPPHVISDPV